MKNNNKYTQSEVNELSHFNKLSKSYDANYNYNDPFTIYKIVKKSKSFASLLKKTIRTESLKILEIGCGTGEYTKYIGRYFPKSKIIGLDISDKIIEVARDKCKSLKNVSFVTQSAYKTNFKDEQFDVVCGFYVLHHLKSAKLSKEILRVLKKEGYVYFCEPNLLNPIVYLIKSNKILKKMAGDSPDEWAINPLTIRKDLKGFKEISISMSEFIIPLKILSYKLKVDIDRVFDHLNGVPLLRYLGGTVRILFKKNAS